MAKSACFHGSVPTCSMLHIYNFHHNISKYLPNIDQVESSHVSYVKFTSFIMFHDYNPHQSQGSPRVVPRVRTPKNCADAEATEPATIPTAAPSVRILGDFPAGSAGFMEKTPITVKYMTVNMEISLCYIYIYDFRGFPSGKRLHNC